MLKQFISSKKLTGRFAVVKLWPGIMTAEDECIARFKIAAKALGLNCVEIYQDGRYVDQPNQMISKNDVDFVLHLHYDVPKLYDAFSFVALWNPIQFYHKWGYARCSRNLLSHDDFVSCSSVPAEHHVDRLIRNSFNHLSPLFTLYHSISDIVYSPSLGDHKLFYAGINWDVIVGGVSRHQELLKYLDKTDALRIYGPTVFQGVKVWAGYKSYVREVPFDGVSIIKELSKAGISLVLSSEAHKQSELMSNRLFESVAAGALVICDENNFAKKFFGSSLLYIDTQCSVEETAKMIFKHMDWAKKNPKEALHMIATAQQIFRDKFSLKKSIYELYQGLAERKMQLLQESYPKTSKAIRVSLNILMPDFDEASLKSQVASISSQEYKPFIPTLIIDRGVGGKNRQKIRMIIAKSLISIKLLEVDYFSYGLNNKNKRRRKLGAVITELFSTLTSGCDAVLFIGPNEKIFSNHLSVLAGSLARNPDAACAATSVIVKHQKQVVRSIYETIDFSQLNNELPIGYARFMFRLSMLATDISCALPYLDRKIIPALIGENKVHQELPSTVIIDTSKPFPCGDWDEGQENELIASYCPIVFTRLEGYEIKLPVLSAPAPMDVVWVGQRPKHIKWVIAQIRALFKEGLSARIDALKIKLGVYGGV